MREMLERSYSQVYKNVRIMFQNPFRLMDTTVWPLTFMIATVFLAQALNSNPAVLALVILGIIGWQVVQQTQMGIATSYMDEFWSHSLTHLFVTPIRLSEYVLGGVFTGIIKCLIIFALFFSVAILAYQLTIPDLLSYGIALFFLFIFGISLGMLNLAFIFPRGENALFMVWTIPDILVVFSGVYYPLEMLPQPLYSIAYLLPSSHAFNLVKETIGLAHTDWIALIGLSIAWFFGTWLFLKHSYQKAKKTGKLVRVA